MRGQIVPGTHLLALQVSEQTLIDLLITAVEGGSNYWATITAEERNAAGDYVKVRVLEAEASGKDGVRVHRIVTPHDLLIGLQRLAYVAADEKALADFPTALKHLTDALTDHDATTADVVLQMAVFGEVVYG